MTVTKEQVDQIHREFEFPELPPYGVLAVSEAHGRVYKRFSLHNSLRAIKTHITTASTTYDYRTGRKVTSGEIVATAYYRVFERHGMDWIPVYDIPDGLPFKKEHALWKDKAPTEKLTAPEEDVAAAIASIVGVGGQVEDET